MSILTEVVMWIVSKDRHDRCVSSTSHHLTLRFAFVAVLVLVLCGPTLLAQAWANAGMIKLTLSLSNQTEYEAFLLAKQAEDLLNKASNLITDDKGIWRAKGRALYARGDVDGAIKAWRQGSLAEEFLEYANNARWHGDREEVVKWYTLSAQVDPLWEEPLYRLGLFYESNSELDNAIQVYQSALGRNSQNGDIWYHLGKVHESRREWSVARETFERCLSASLGNDIGLSNVYYHLGYTMQYDDISRDLEGAWEAYGNALALDDFSTEHWLKAVVHFQRGMILSRSSNWEKAEKEFAAATEINPNYYWAHIGWANSLKETGEMERAKQVLMYAIDLRPDVSYAYHILGDIYLLEGNEEKANDLHKQAEEFIRRNEDHE